MGTIRRLRHRARQISIAIMLIGLLAGVAGLSKGPAAALHAPQWLLQSIGVLVGLAGILGLVLSFAHQQIDDDVQRQSIIEAHLLRWPLERVDETDPFADLGVSRSAIADKYRHSLERPPYVPRVVDGELQAALRTEHFILLVGPSKAGKSRTAYEAILHTFPDRDIVIPRKAASLPELLKLDPPIIPANKPTVLWLDECDRYISSNALDSAMLDAWRLTRELLVVVATMRASEHERLRSSTEEVSYQMRSVLNRATTIYIDEEVTDRERTDFEQLYPRERLTKGIGECLTAGDELVTKYRNGTSTCPEGVAVVRAAIDWRRAGVSRPISQDELKTLYCSYLLAIRPTEAVTAEHFDRGLQWARTPASSSIALLNPVNPGAENAFQVFDYILDHVDGEITKHPFNAHPILDETWNNVLEHADYVDLFSVGLAAYGQDKLLVAQQAWSKAMLYAPGWVSNMAALELGALLAEQDNYEATKSAQIGVLLLEHGETAKAEVALREAVELQLGHSAHHVRDNRREHMKRVRELAQAEAEGHLSATEIEDDDKTAEQKQ